MSMARLPTETIGDGTPVRRAERPVAIEMPAAAASRPERAPAHRAAKLSLVLCMWVIRHEVPFGWVGRSADVGDDLVEGRPRGAVRRGRVVWIGVAEGDAADHLAGVRKVEVLAEERGAGCE